MIEIEKSMVRLGMTKKYFTIEVQKECLAAGHGKDFKRDIQKGCPATDGGKDF